MNSTTPLIFPATTPGFMPYTGKISGPSIVGQVEISNNGGLGNNLPNGSLSDFERLLAQITGSDAQKALYSGTQANGQPASSPFASVLGTQTSADGISPEVINPLIPSTSPYTIWSEHVQNSLGASPKTAEATSQFEMDDQGRLLISAQLLSEIFAKLKTLQNKEARESANPSAQPTADAVNALKSTGAVADIQEPSTTSQKGASLAELANLIQQNNNQSTATAANTDTSITPLLAENNADGEASDSLTTASVATTAFTADTSGNGDTTALDPVANSPLTVTPGLTTSNQTSTDISTTDQTNTNESEPYDLTSGNVSTIALSLQAILASLNQAQAGNASDQTTPTNGTNQTSSDSTSQVVTVTGEPVPSNSKNSKQPSATVTQPGVSTKNSQPSSGTTIPTTQITGTNNTTKITTSAESIAEKPQQPETTTTSQQSNPVSKSDDLYLRIPVESLPEPLRNAGQGLVLHVSAASASGTQSATGLGTQVSYNGETFNVEILTDKALQSQDSTSGEFPEKGQPNMLKIDLETFLKGESTGTKTPITTESEFAKAQRELIVEAHRERKNLPPEAVKAERKESGTSTEAKADRSVSQVQESGRTTAQTSDSSSQSTQHTQSTQQTQTTSSAAAAREAVERYQQISQQVVRSVSSTIGEGRSQVTIRLVPEALGQVDVRLTLDSGVLTARLWANTSETRQLLEQHASHLRASLEESGVRVDRVVVARETAERNGYQREQSDQGRSFAQNRQHSNQQQQQRNGWNEESRTRQREQPFVSFEDISTQATSG